MSSKMSNKQIALILDHSPPIKPKELAKRNPNDLIRKLLPKNKKTFINKKENLITSLSNSHHIVKTIQIKTEETQPDNTLGKVLTSEASTLINDKQLKIYSNKTKGYIFKNHRSLQKNNKQEDDQINDTDIINFKPLFTEYHQKQLPQTLSKAKLANSIYFVLGKRHVDRVEKLKRGLPDNSIYFSLVNQRKQCSKKHPVTFYLSQDKKEKVIPFGDPLPLIHDQQFSNESELNRYQKMYESLLNLKYKINNNPDQEGALLKEFLFNNGLYKPEYFTSDSLSKLSSFIKSNFIINPKQSLKLNLIKIIDSSRLEDKETNTPIYKSLSKSKGGKSTNNIKETNKDNKLDIRLNMNLQKNLYETKALRTDIDLVNNPEPTIEELKKELNHCYSNIPFKKAANNSYLMHYNNMKNTPFTAKIGKHALSKGNAQLDIAEVKKRNKLLEYICYEKALNYSQVKQCNQNVPFLKQINI